MKLNEALAIKRAVQNLYEELDGQALIRFLEDRSGHLNPTYNAENSTSIILAAGRTEMMQTLRNLNRLTAEQIQDYCQEGQSDE